MKKLLALGALLGALLAGPAEAVVQQTKVGDAAYSILGTDQTVVTGTTFTAPRIWTLPYAAATCIGQSCSPQNNTGLQIIDLANAITYQNTLTITPQSGETINGNTGSITLSLAGARALLIPTSGSNWKISVTGDFQTSGACLSSGSTATVTITIAAPGVITDTAHGYTGACPVVFTNSGGGLPTGITSGTTYWIVPASITANTYTLATTVANALAGTAITTTGSSTGTQTRTGGAPLTTNTAANITGLSLTQGDWQCDSTVSRVLGASTSVTKLQSSTSQTTATMGNQGINGSMYLATAANVMGALGTDTKTTQRIALTATTTLYLVADDTFTVSTNNAYGALSCRRTP